MFERTSKTRAVNSLFICLQLGMGKNLQAVAPTQKVEVQRDARLTAIQPQLQFLGLYPSLGISCKLPLGNQGTIHTIDITHAILCMQMNLLFPVNPGNLLEVSKWYMPDDQR